jgi:hypothetical protein
MGVPKLNKKVELNYRRKSASRSCADCNHYWPSFPFESKPEKHEPRCGKIGIKPGRAYRISPNGLCDKHDNSEYLERLLRGSSFAKNNQI